MEKKKNILLLEKEYEKVKSEIKNMGFILKGTITRRVIIREDKRNPGGQRKFGPYYQWTWKKEKKTVTVNLTKSQSQEYTKAIKNHRKMEKSVEKMERLSLQILEKTTEGVEKRKNRKLL